MKQAFKKPIIILLQLFVAGTGLAIIGLSAAYLYLSPNLPSVESIRDVRLQTPLRIYSSDKKLIGEIGEKRRTPVKLEDVPQNFIDALLAAEDADFYFHNGVSIRGLLRAATELITTGKKGSGGSTLTMQLTRNVFFSLEKRFGRKFNEILLSLKLERELSKDEILELYVNYMFLGKRAYGIQAAAQVYYGKNLNELSMAQLAMIAGLFQGPSIKNPIVNPERAVERRDWILGRMKNLDLINQEHYLTAISEPVTARYHGSQLEANAPYVAELAREKTIRSFGLKAYTEGYRVYTTIDSELQAAAQQAIVNGLISYDQRHGYRGPELKISSRLSLEQAPTPEGHNHSETEATTHITTPILNSKSYIETLVQLESIPTYANLEPAVVIATDAEALHVLLRSGRYATLNWEDGLKNTRPYLSENSRGPKPNKATDIAVVGDVIRVKQTGPETWQLTQLPDAQAALVALNPNNGSITSIVGGFDFYESNFNRATQAYRQPGSNFKPFIYTAALEMGLTPASLINDAPIVFDDAALEGTWRPENDSGKFYGPTRIRKALYLSRNVVSIRLLQQLGLSKAVNSLDRFGFDSKSLPRDLSLALGTHAVTPIDLATAWASFANGGHKVNAHLIQRIVDSDGNIIYEAFPKTVCRECAADPIEEIITEGDKTDIWSEDIFSIPVKLKRELGLLEPKDYPKANKIIDDRVAFIIDSMLQDVIKKGTGAKARVLRRSDIAGKTGTTNGPNDAWFSGYNPDIITTTWVGFDQNKPLGNREYGGSAALPIWINFMREALKKSTPKARIQPPGVVTVKIDPETGQRAKYGDPDAIFEYFRAENAPEIPTQSENTTTPNPLEVFSEDIF